MIANGLSHTFQTLRSDSNEKTNVLTVTLELRKKETSFDARGESIHFEPLPSLFMQGP